MNNYDTAKRIEDNLTATSFIGNHGKASVWSSGLNTSWFPSAPCPGLLNML